MFTKKSIPKKYFFHPINCVYCGKSVMKYLIIILLLASCTINHKEAENDKKYSEDEVREIVKQERDDARWKEKLRWSTYINDSIIIPSYYLSLSVYCRSNFSAMKGFDSLLNLVEKSDNPFYK